MGVALATPTLTAAAYDPGPDEVAAAADASTCNKFPCVLYPKSTQLPSGRLIAGWESSTGPVVGQTLPIYVSDDLGDSWSKLTDVKPPAQLSTDAKYAPYTSNWTNPKFFVMPESIGQLAKGTLLLADVVSGDGADGNSRHDVAIVLYASNDEGESWRVVDVVAKGGDMAKDPVWEPFLLVYEGKLVVYYSDENDYLSYDPTTGVPVIDPDNGNPDADSGGQVLVHKTWDGTGAWSEPVIDVPGDVVDRGNGKSEIGGNRPGMTTVVPTADGKWLATFEYFGGGAIGYKLADSPLDFYEEGATGKNGLEVTQLPVASGSAKLPSEGGAPVLYKLPNGAILYNASNSADIWVNESGKSDGVWKQYQTPVDAGYSRAMQYVVGTGRISILQTKWAGQSLGPIRHGEVDLGHSEGAYYSLVNRKTGQYLSTDANKTQDANLTGDKPDIITWSNDASNDTQRWHVQPKGDAVTFLNKSGGRALGIWWGSSSAGAKLAQWVDDNGADKKWKLEPTSDGYVHVRSTLNSSLLMTAGSAGAAVTTAAAVDASVDPGADDAQEWMLVQEQPTAADLTDVRASSVLAPSSTTAGAEITLNAAHPAGMIGVPRSNVQGHVYAVGTEATLDLGNVSFGSDSRGTFTVPTSISTGTYRLAVLFDEGPLVWEGLEVTSSVSPSPSPSASPTPTVSASPSVSTSPSATASAAVASISSSTAQRGGKVRVSVSGLTAGEQISAELHSDPIRISGIPTADTTGRVSFDVTIPITLPFGSHTIVISDASGKVIAQLPVTVLADEQLTVTGAQAPWGIALLAAVFLTAGLGFRILRPRRVHA